jgi:hypothetical protein
MAATADGKIGTRAYNKNASIHCKKGYNFFSSPAVMSQTKLSLAGHNLILPGQGEFG